jgi:hypothetical protein
MKFSVQIAFAFVSLSLIGAGAAKADTVFQYAFNSGSFYNFQDGGNNSVTGTFSYDATNQTVSDVNYSRGDDIFTVGLVGSPTELYFGDTTSGDYDVYEFKNSLALGGTDTITGGFHPAIVVDVGGSVSTAGAAAVPEPASWALLIMGFGLVGCATRSRKSAAWTEHAH